MTLVTLISHGAVAVASLIVGWYGHMHFGAKAQSVVDVVKKIGE